MRDFVLWAKLDSESKKHLGSINTTNPAKQEFNSSKKDNAQHFLGSIQSFVPIGLKKVLEPKQQITTNFLSCLFLEVHPSYLMCALHNSHFCNQAKNWGGIQNIVI